MMTSARPWILAAAQAAVLACGGPRTAGTGGPPGADPGATAAAAADAAAPPLPGRAEPCAEGRCAAGLECVEYYGIAGAAGPTFTSCETPCGRGAATCPEGTACATVADGPGAVCR